MTASPAPAAPQSGLPPQPAPGFTEFVILIASLIALGALGIDAILPALPAIGHAFAVTDPNHLQWIISAYFLGLGAGQLVFGALSDWLGRKRVLLGGVIIYILLMLVSAWVQNLAVLIALRALQGFAASSASVITRSIVRDLYNGPKMAKVMSISYVIFLSVPILAPSFGQLILLVLPWRAIFLVMAAIGTAVAIWAWLRLPETRPLDMRHRPDIGHLKRVTVFVLTEPSSLFYTLSITFLFATLTAYVSLVPQIFVDVFQRPTLMAPIFAVCAATMGAGGMLNAWLVERLGSRRIAHIALTSFVGLTAVHFAWAIAGQETLISFTLLQALTMGCMSLTTSNFSAIAMEKVGHVAGTAASIQGVITTIGGSLIGGLIGQQWHGDIYLLPLSAGLCGIVALSLVAFGEKGKLYARL